jgi:polyisoprenoid-binding protein YceI
MRQFHVRTVVLVATAAFSLPLHSAVAESYIFHSKKTEVRFSFVMTLGAVQRGRFSSVEGALQYDEKAPEKSTVFARIAAASVETGQPIIDDELRGSNFFNARNEPALTFRSRLVKPKAAGAAEVTGDMTVNGITKPVTLEVVVTPNDDPALKYSAGSKKFYATTTLSRSAFRMDSYADMVGDEIKIEIDAVVRPQR